MRMCSSFFHYRNRADDIWQIPERNELAYMGLFNTVIWRAAAPGSRAKLKDLHPMRVDYHALAVRLDELSRGFLRQWANKNRP
jgi:hypothetical protein